MDSKRNVPITIVTSKPTAAFPSGVSFDKVSLVVFAAYIWRALRHRSIQHSNAPDCLLLRVYNDFVHSLRQPVPDIL